MKKAIVIIGKKDFYHSIETASIEVASKEGGFPKSLPKRHTDIFTEEELEVWKKCLNTKCGEELELTHGEMELITVMNDLQYRSNWIKRI